MENFNNNIKGLEKFLGIGILLFVIIFLWSTLAGTFNTLATKQVAYETARANIETQLQRRFDLVPSLVGATRGVLNQEQEVFGAIAEARTRYAGAQSGTPDKLEAASQYQSALARLLVVIENYPQLRSNDTVRDLMVQLEGTENRISVARERYNESAQDYNRTLRRFPTNLIGGMFGYEDAPLYEAVDGAEFAPTVDLETGLQGNDDSGEKPSGQSAQPR